ncbi:hypothetical protein CXG45_17720 [Pseudomonas plecoglossicida]|nr:hypothetical protein CXG45_17720 [Pseudomonas plecoglossicida]
MPAKQATPWMAPAAPVFAGAPAPTCMAHSFSWWGPCGSGHAREAGDAVDGTGCAGVRGRARSHRYGAFLQLVVPLCAGLPAKQATRWKAPATPVFAGAPTATVWCPPDLKP